MAGRALRQRQGALAQAGEMPVGFATLTDRDPSAAALSRGQIYRGHGGTAAPRGNGLNARAVVAVLDSYGLDPIEELAKILQATQPLRDRQGQEIKDDKGAVVTVPVLDTDTKVRTLTELAQYTRAKLKSIEVVMKPAELTDEQIDKRLESLLALAKPKPKAKPKAPKPKAK